MAEKAFTQADFDRWMPVKEAVSLVAEEHEQGTAIRAIAKRLATGQIEARAERLFVDRRRIDQQFPPIRLDVWEALLGEDYLTLQEFWKTGDLEIDVYGTGGRSSATFDIYTVRFESSGIRKIVEKPAPITTAAEAYAAQVAPPKLPVLDVNLQDEPGDRRPVTSAALKIWAEAFAKIHKGNDVLQPLAVRSAQGMFPDKSVSRDRAVAALKAAGVTFQRGPKKQISDN